MEVCVARRMRNVLFTRRCGGSDRHLYQQPYHLGMVINEVLGMSS